LKFVIILLENLFCMSCLLFTGTHHLQTPINTTTTAVVVSRYLCCSLV
jgi:hypothetical protein